LKILNCQLDDRDDMTEELPPTDKLGLWALIREDWVANGRDWSRPGLRSLAVYRFGYWRMTVRFKPARMALSFVFHRLHRFCRNRYGIELPHTAVIGRRLTIEHQHGIVVHGGVRMGDDCTIRQGVTLGNKTKDRPMDAPTLGHRVNVGAGAAILGAVSVGDDAQVGANAVVLKDVPAGAIAVGVPAKVIWSGMAAAKPRGTN
jgi:serine acetyltransferase